MDCLSDLPEETQHWRFLTCGTIGEYMCVGFSPQPFMSSTLGKKEKEKKQEVKAVTTQSEEDEGRTQGSYQVQEE